MSNRNWVCFKCRVSVRRIASYAGVVPCANCGDPSWCLSHKIPIPPKTKKHEWVALKLAYFEERREREFALVRESVEAKHALEQEIVRLESLPNNPGREGAVKVLKARLANLESGRNA